MFPSSDSSFKKKIDLHLTKHIALEIYFEERAVVESAYNPSMRIIARISEPTYKVLYVHVNSLTPIVRKAEPDKRIIRV